MPRDRNGFNSDPLPLTDTVVLIVAIVLALAVAAGVLALIAH